MKTVSTLLTSDRQQSKNPQHSHQQRNQTQPPNITQQPINTQAQKSSQQQQKPRKSQHKYIADLHSCDSLEKLREMIETFDLCDLKFTANKTVFADGNPNAKIMLIGEGPGANEDEQGIPFCGQSGKLLRNAFQSIGLTTDKIYITNTVFWRPPGNRKPTPEEISLCLPFLQKHIALIRPLLVVMVGATAKEALLPNNHAGVTALRGQYFFYQNDFMENPVKTTLIFHPSYLLRQQSKKKELWEDLIRIQQFIDSNL